MVKCIVLTTTELEFSGNICGPWSVYCIRYTASHFKIVALLCKWIAQCSKMEGSNHVN